MQSSTNLGLKLRKAVGESKDIVLPKFGFKEQSYDEFKAIVVEARGSIDSYGESGKTALYFALERKLYNKAIVLLKETAADLFLVAHSTKKTPMQIADENWDSLPYALKNLLRNELAFRKAVLDSQNKEALIQQRKFRQAAVFGELAVVKEMLEKGVINRKNIHAQDPVTGRTVWHELFMNMKADKKILAVAQLLFEKFNLDLSSPEIIILDKEGFDPHQLVFSPHDFMPEFIPSEDFLKKEAEYENFIVSEMNKKLKPHGAVMALVHHIREIPQIIAANKKLNKICFLIKRPNSAKTYSYTEKDGAVSLIADRHIVPLYFQRNGQQENYVQFDSNNGIFYALPANPRVAQRIFFNPFPRQVSINGCLEDGAVVLCKMAMTPDLIEFCEKNSTPFDPDRKLSETENEFRIQNILAYNAGRLDFENFVKMIGYGLGKVYSRVVNGELIPAGLQPITSIHRLNCLPPFMMVHLERYDAMRFFRTTRPDLFKNMKEIMAFGKLRDDKMQPEEIAGKLKDPNQCYDFKGIDFSERLMAYHQTYELVTFFKSLKSTKEKAEQITTHVVEYAAPWKNYEFGQ